MSEWTRSLVPSTWDHAELRRPRPPSPNGGVRRTRDATGDYAEYAWNLRNWLVAVMFYTISL